MTSWRTWPLSSKVTEQWTSKFLPPPYEFSGLWEASTHTLWFHHNNHPRRRYKDGPISTLWTDTKSWRSKKECGCGLVTRVCQGWTRGWSLTFRWRSFFRTFASQSLINRPATSVHLDPSEMQVSGLTLDLLNQNLHFKKTVQVCTQAILRNLAVNQSCHF